jgi:hypothetical protein
MNPSYSPRSAWTWRPVELAALVVGFIAWWPLGLAVLAWKFWNDRSARPKDFETALRDGFMRLRETGSRLFTGASPIAEDDLAPTGNAAFDAHVRETIARIDADRRALMEEIRAFRAFLAEEQAGRNEMYERFKAKNRRD